MGPQAPDNAQDALNEVPYSYTQLAENDIRLVTLMPGDYHDEITIRISHTAFKPPKARPARRMNLTELRQTLPSGWNAYETLDNRYLFYWGELNFGGVFKSSWAHPDPAVDRSRYELPLDNEHSNGYPRYEALSYTWGSQQNATHVWVEEASGVSRLSVGRSLDCALRHLRYKKKTRTLWVDALSINQSDIPERDNQVRRMADIYRIADRVIAWLGPEADNSKHALATLEFLGKQSVLTLDEWIFSAPGATETAWCMSKCRLPYDQLTWLAIHTLLLRSWFERVWVVQEIQLANCSAVLKCGGDEISWTHFRYAVVLLWQKESIPPAISRKRIALAGRITTVNDFKSPVSAVLRRTEGRHCSDPRDVIYGLLGILPLAFSMKIHPQYALSTGEVYRDFFLAHMEHTGSLELLRTSSLGGGRTDAPSWVPDFSSRYAHDIERQFYTGYSRSVAEFHPPNILKVVGLRCATVLSVTDPVPSSATRLALETVRKWELQNLQEGSYITGESFLHAYAKTLTVDYLRERFPTMSTATVEEWVRQDSEYAFFGEKAKKRLEGNIALSRQEDYALNVLMGKTYITTHEGYIGLGSTHAREGKCRSIIAFHLIYKLQCP
jgi:hypothetical protein